ncbi:unnamed protein product [Ilex paraguariensis]|uniref:Uncharacterized protein n=1 Tax=Ilex paraguariensis TaxID=185542 RepID=A0ABC8TU07_9AQUA
MYGKQMSPQLSIDINNELASLSPTPFEPYIFRVDGLLRRENELAYEPEILAIGPYHHGKANLEMMENHKLRYLQMYLARTNESSVDRYVNAMQDLEEKTRKCYVESIELEKDAFVRMTLLDGCFIIEFFYKLAYEEVIDDPIFKLQRFTNTIFRDLLLFENQLPFFVLERLLGSDLLDINDLISQIPFLFSHLFSQSSTYSDASDVPRENVKHLLGLVHDTWCSSFKMTVSSRRVAEDQERTWEYIKCSTQLREVGVKFKKATETSSLLDIEFENGIMKIPPLSIYDSTEVIFRNLVAFEQYNDINEPAYVTDYRKFLDCLINSPTDVEILRHCGIIDNWLGDDEAVSSMLNRLGNNVILDSTSF